MKKEFNRFYTYKLVECYVSVLLQRFEMTIEEVVVQGESKGVEFKIALPKDSKKYTKTVVAFANTQGGQLIIGIDDNTREIVGVNESELFRMIDTIANAVSDSCEPQIVPIIEPYTIKNKTVIVVTIAAGPHRPYYLKSEGKEFGTYVRVGATSRPATKNKIRELELEGEKISWDELVCIGYKVTKAAIDKLCRDINHYREEMHKNVSDRLPTVTVKNLENWNILKKSENGYLALNAFVLLTGEYFRFSKTQCAVFAGTERGNFIDKQDYNGPLYEQIEKTYSFVLRNIRKSAKVEGLIRRECFELPPDAIREMIVNAHCHRNFLDTSCVQVALYDDRLEITSPGGLCNGLTLEEALSGRSRQRNRAIAEVFNQMGLIEAWGNGLKNIRESAKNYGLRDPEFIEMPETFRVNLFRPTDTEDGRYIGETSEKHRNNDGDKLNASQKRILSLLSENAQLSAQKIAEKIGISSRNVESNIKKLKEQGILVRHGSPKDGYWEILEKQ